MVELLNIIDLVASVEEDMHVSYNYLGFASVLSRMIGNEEKARYYKGQMAVAQMLISLPSPTMWMMRSCLRCIA